jgi:hypothetical protein
VLQMSLVLNKDSRSGFIMPSFSLSTTISSSRCHFQHSPQLPNKLHKLTLAAQADSTRLEQLSSHRSDPSVGPPCENKGCVTLCGLVAIYIIKKYYLKAKENLWKLSNISPCKNIIFKKIL